MHESCSIWIGLDGYLSVHVEFPRLHAKNAVECGASLVFGTRFLLWRMHDALLAVRLDRSGASLTGVPATSSNHRYSRS